MADTDRGKEFSGPSSDPDPSRKLPPEARRALAEAALRRQHSQVCAERRVKELGGRKGPEPTRFGDWERRGIAHDF